LPISSCLMAIEWNGPIHSSANSKERRAPGICRHGICPSRRPHRLGHAASLDSERPAPRPMVSSAKAPMLPRTQCVCVWPSSAATRTGQHYQRITLRVRVPADCTAAPLSILHTYATCARVLAGQRACWGAKPRVSLPALQLRRCMRYRVLARIERRTGRGVGEA